MKKLGNEKMDFDSLLDEADKNKDGVIDYEGWFAILPLAHPRFLMEELTVKHGR